MIETVPLPLIRMMANIFICLTVNLWHIFMKIQYTDLMDINLDGLKTAGLEIYKENVLFIQKMQLALDL